MESHHSFRSTTSSSGGGGGPPHGTRVVLGRETSPTPPQGDTGGVARLPQEIMDKYNGQTREVRILINKVTLETRTWLYVSETVLCKYVLHGNLGLYMFFYLPQSRSTKMSFFSAHLTGSYDFLLLACILATFFPVRSRFSNRAFTN